MLPSASFFKLPSSAITKTNEDLIGRVVFINEQKVVQVNSNPQRLIDFVIEDSRGSWLTVTLWEEHVDSVLPYYNVSITQFASLIIDRISDTGNKMHDIEEDNDILGDVNVLIDVESISPIDVDYS
nr:replication factor A protein 1-like [Ipomoea batatas]